MSTSDDPPRDGAPRLVEELASHPHGDALAKLVHALAFSAFDERRTELDQGLADAADRLGVDEVAAETSHGNVLRALKKGQSATAPERALLGALLARGVALSPPADEKACERVALGLAHVAAHTAADGLASLDAALGAKASDVWKEAAQLIERHQASPSALLPRPSEIVLAAALGASLDPSAKDARASLHGALRDPLLLTLLERAEERSAAEPLVLSAEVVRRPRSPLVLLLLTVTLILPAVALLSLLGRYAFHMRRPAELRISGDGVTVDSRMQLFGKTLRETKLFIPRAGLARIAREVRYPRLATYAGIATLLVGSYVGVRLVIDGARAGAPEFLGIGVAVLVVALAVDYGLARIPGGSKGHCQLLFQARKGHAISLAVTDPALADRALSLIATTKP